jgi:cyclic pyranopterin monophosphate synthase
VDLRVGGADSLDFSDYIDPHDMRDISHKTTTARSAKARALVKVHPDTITLLKEGKAPKGDPFPVAKVAAIQAAKNTSQLIPYCHPLPIDFVDCQFEFSGNTVVITTEVKAVYKTGVEMEALTAASVAALTVYDMLKPVDESMEITSVTLVEKRGGKSDFVGPSGKTLRAAVLVMSDSVAAGTTEDSSGLRIVERLREKKMDVVDYKIVPDIQHVIEQTLIQFADSQKIDLVITTGGTGLGIKDVTPEAMSSVITKEIPGIGEAARAFGQNRTPLAMLSRGRAGLRGSTIIVNLPGSPRAVEESLDAILPGLLHAFKMLKGERH